MATALTYADERPLLSVLLRFSASAGLVVLVGFLREITVLRHFGASPETDALYLSLAPLMLCSGVMLSVGESRFVPLLARDPWGRHRELRVLAAKIGLGIALVWLAIALATLPLLRNTRWWPLPATLAIESAALIPFAIYAASRSHLLAQERGGLANLGTAVGNGIGIGLILVWASPLVLPVSVAVAAIVQALISSMALLRSTTHAAKESLHTTSGWWVFVLAAVISYSAVSVDRGVGSFLGAGAVTALAVADRIWQVPLTLVGVALGASVFPRMSRVGQTAVASEVITGAIVLGRALAVPFAAGGILFSTDVIAFVAGPAFAKIGAQSTMALIWFCLAIPPSILGTLYVRTLLAAGLVRVVAVSSGLSFCMNVILDLLGASVGGVAGIAASTFCVYVLVDCVMLILIRRRLVWTQSLTIMDLVCGPCRLLYLLWMLPCIVGMLAVHALLPQGLVRVIVAALPALVAIFAGLKAGGYGIRARPFGRS